MTSTSDSVIVSHSTCNSCSALVMRVHHRQCPTIFAEGMSVGLAAKDLAEKLTSLLNHSREPQRREAIEHALADVRGFLSATDLGSCDTGGITSEQHRPGRTPGACPTDVVNVRPLGPWLAGARAIALIEGKDLEVVRLVVPRGKEISPHTTRGEATVQCLEGRVAFTVNRVTHELGAGDLFHLWANQPHSISGIDDASLLMTIALCGQFPVQATSLHAPRMEV